MQLTALAPEGNLSAPAGRDRAFSAFSQKTLAALSAEATPLESLAHHCFVVDHDLPFEKVEKVFREKGVEFLALVQGGRVTGLCARVKLGALLGSRYGFALYAKSPAHLAQVDHPLLFSKHTPVRQLLDVSLSRGAHEFQEDVILVNDDQSLVGLIAVDALAHLQSRLVGEQVTELRRQHEALQRQNGDLYRANEAIRQAEGVNRGLFESNTLGVALLDIQGAIQLHNGRLAELLNAADGPLPMCSLDSFMSDQDRLKFRRFIAAHGQPQVGAGGPHTQEFYLQVPGGGQRLFRFTTGWIKETRQVCACLDDITEQRALERNMMKQEKQRLLDTLVGGIAHELNNKLTPVLGFSEMLSEQLAGELRAQAGLISRSAGEALRIVRQLLQLSKPESGRPQRVDLATVIDESLVMLKFQVRERGCEVRIKPPASPVVVMADPGQLKQVVINLVINALHAMEKVPAPVLTITVGKDVPGAFFSVADNGCGIAPEHMARIFDPFFTTKSPDRGSGLGLSICFSIARQYGGDIAVESEPGNGATFTVTLPPVLGAAEAPQGERTATQPAPRPSDRSIKVLVAEDEDIVWLVIREMIRMSLGCHVDHAPNGAEALALAERTDYDLVISDIRMPVMTGTQLYLRLREARPELSRRFIFITGHSGEWGLQDEMAQWAVPVLRKPFVPARLMEVCEPLLARTRQKDISVGGLKIPGRTPTS
jgi:signal transduction histidine kinase